MARTSFIELDSGDQIYFDNVYEALKEAKRYENERKNSVELIAISDETVEDLDHGLVVYRGQKLRHMLRSVDSVSEWIRSQVEQGSLYAEEGESS